MNYSNGSNIFELQGAAIADGLFLIRVVVRDRTFNGSAIDGINGGLPINFGLCFDGFVIFRFGNGISSVFRSCFWSHLYCEIDNNFSLL